MNEYYSVFGIRKFFMNEYIRYSVFGIRSNSLFGATLICYFLDEKIVLGKVTKTPRDSRAIHTDFSMGVGGPKGSTNKQRYTLSTYDFYSSNCL